MAVCYCFGVGVWGCIGSCAGLQLVWSRTDKRMLLAEREWELSCAGVTHLFTSSSARHRCTVYADPHFAAIPALPPRSPLLLYIIIIADIRCARQLSPTQMAQPQPFPPQGAAPPSIPLSAAQLSLLDSIPHAHIPHTLKTVTIAPNAPPDIANKSFVLVVCKLHDQQKCDQCRVDFTPVNYLHQFLRFAPAEAIPPPPNVGPPPQRAQAVTNLKDAGNVCIVFLSPCNKYDILEADVLPCLECVQGAKV